MRERRRGSSGEKNKIFAVQSDSAMSLRDTNVPKSVPVAVEALSIEAPPPLGRENRQTFHSMTREERKQAYKKGGCCAISLFIFLIIVCAMSISRMHYNEMGFKRKRTSGTVDRETVYTSGRYWLGLNGVFVKYPASAVDEMLVDLSAWTRATEGGANSDAGTAVLIDISFQYQLIASQLPDLYSKVGTEFQGYIKNVAISTVKNNATLFSSDDFIKSRKVVEGAFRDALAVALEKEANVKLLQVQMRDIEFPSSFMQRKLASSVQELKNQAEEYRKTSRVSRVNTTRLAKAVENDAYEIQEQAIADAGLLTSKAANEAKRLTERSRSDGLKVVTDAVGISTVKQIVSLDYMLNLMDKSPGETYVNFDSITKTVN